MSDVPWVTPKTNWKIQPRDKYGRYNGDWFNVNPDYNRIKGNIEYVAGRVGWFFDRVTDLIPMAEVTTSTLVFISHLNNIEQNIDRVNTHLPIPLPLEATKRWVENGPSPTIGDLNRIERSIQLLYDAVPTQSEFTWKIPFNMGGRRF